MNRDAERLSAARGRILLEAPGMALALNRLTPEAREGLKRPATDGSRFYYDPAWLHEIFARDGGAALAGVYLHSVAHCLLGTAFDGKTDGFAADVMAALFIDDALPAFSLPRGNGLFSEMKRRLAGVRLEDVAAAIRSDAFFAENRRPLEALLKVDDHRLWIAPTPGANGGAGEGWQSLRRSLRLGGNVRRGQSPGTARRRFEKGSPPNRAWREMLSSLAVVREFPREDPDAFQPGLYAHGLALYGNVPIIEPGEAREERRLDELAVVIDTSGSCVEQLTARFLEETRAMLADETLFFPRFNLWILQCDAKVQRADRVTDVREFEKYVDALEIVGGGGTDFRPAFGYLDALVNRGAFRRLPGAVFFSDGQGTFPAAAPGYEVMFAFYEGWYDAIDVPDWVRRIVLPPPKELTSRH